MSKGQSIRIVVPGIPGRKAYRPARGGFSRKDTASIEYENRVASFVAGLPRLDWEWIRVDILLIHPRTSALLKQYKDGRYKHPETRLPMPNVPDADNSRKSCQDGLKGKWVDDRRIVWGETLKAYAAIGEEPSTVILLSRPDLGDFVEATRRFD